VPALFEAQPPSFKIVIGKREVTSIRSTYADGAVGELFAILGSMGYLEIAANRGAAAQLVGSGKGTEVEIILQEAIAAGNGR
jgi:S-adenosyl-L-methionine hydrolase (adenosine-forming)